MTDSTETTPIEIFEHVVGNQEDGVISRGYVDAQGDTALGDDGVDIVNGTAGDDHMCGSEWSADGSSDTFVVSSGSGRDMIHDFEADHDVLDLSAYGLEFSDLVELMSNQGCATEIDLSGLAGGQTGDKLILKSIDPNDLDESNFIL